MTKFLRLISAVLFLALPAFAQTGGFYSAVAATQSPGNIPRLLPNAPVVVCNYPSTGGAPCTNKATTYTDATLGTSCLTTAQAVPPGSNACSATADSAANIGFYAVFGNYTYWFEDGSVWKGPFTATIGGGGGSNITGVLPTAGGGLTGGGTSGALTLGLQPCPTGQILASTNGTLWGCSAVGIGTVTSVGGGTGLSGGPITGTGSLSIASSYQLPQICSSNQIPQWNGSTFGCFSLSAYSLVVSNTPLTTTGDVLTISSGALARLGQGANGTFLGVSAGVLGYFTPAGTGTVTHTVGANGLNVPLVGNSGADVQTLDVATNKYMDIPTSGAPGNPGAGFLRFYSNSGSGGFLACLTSSGGNCFATNTPLGTSAQLPLMNAGGTSYAPQTMTQDCTISNTGVITCTKTNNVALTGAATMALPVTAANGGTHLDTSGSTGVPQVASGTWSVSTTLPSGLSATNMTLVTPALGVPTALTLTNATGLPLTGITGETDGDIIGGISGVWTKTTAIPNGVTATTQALADSTTKVATDAFVLANALTNPMTTVGDTLYGGTAGAGTRLAGPTAPAIPYVLTSIPSGGLATAPVWNKVGLVTRTVTGTSDTIAGSDNASVVNYCNNGGSAGPPCNTVTNVAVTLPQAGTGCGTSSDFCSNFVTILIAGPGLVTVTPTTSTINGNAALMMQNQVCRITSDNTNYQAHCWNDNSSTPVQTDTGAANAYVTACPGVAVPIQKGDICAFQAAHQNTTASTITICGNAACTGTNVVTTAALTRQGGGAVLAGDILASPSIAYFMWDGTEAALLDPQAIVAGISPGTNGWQYVNTNGGTGNATDPLTIDAVQFSAATTVNGVTYGNDACGRAEEAYITPIGSPAVPTPIIDSRGEIKDGIACQTPPQFGVIGVSSTGGEWLLPVGQILENTPLFVFGKSTYQGACISYDVDHCSGITSNWNSGTGDLAGISAGAWSNTTSYFQGVTATCGASNCTSGFTSGTYYSVANNNGNGTSGHAPGATGWQPWWTVASFFPSPVAMVEGPVLNAAPANADTESYALRDLSLNCAYAGGATNVSTLGCAGLINSFGQEQGLVTNIKIQNVTAAAGIWQTGPLTEDNGPLGGGTIGYGTTTQTNVDACRVNGSDASQDTAVISSTTKVTSGTSTLLNMVLATAPTSGPWVGDLVDIVNGNLADGLANIPAGLSDETGATHSYYMVWSVADSTHFTVQAPSSVMSCPSACGQANFFPMAINVSYDSTTNRINQNRGFLNWTLNASTCNPAVTNFSYFLPLAAQFSMQDTPIHDFHIEGHRVGVCVGCFGPSVGEHISNLLAATKLYTGILIDNKFAGTNGTSGTDIKDETCLGTGPNNLPGQAGTPTYCIVDLINGNNITEANNPYVLHYWLDNNGTAFFEGGNCADMTNGWCESNGVWAFYGGTTGVASGFKQGSFGLDLVAGGTLSAEASTAAGTYTIGNLACVTATNTVGDCTSAANNSFFIGINLAKDGALPNWATAGNAIVNLHAGGATAGDYVCTNASFAAVAVDNGVTACPSPQRQIGIVKVTTAGTAVAVSLIFSGATGGGGGSGTVNNCATGGALGVYLSTGTAISCQADWTYASHQIVGGSSAQLAIQALTNQMVMGGSTNLTTLNFPASSGAVTLTFPITTDTMVGRATTDTLTNKSLSEDQLTGAAAAKTLTEAGAGDVISHASVETANLTAGQAFYNTNSTNNNTSTGLIVGAAGTSTGGVAEVLFDVSGTGDIERWYTGGSVSAGVYTPGTLKAHIDNSGDATFAGTLSVTGHVTLEGVTSAGATGTSNLVFSNTPTLVTPVLGAATATSLLASGIVDGKAPITVTTGTTATLGAATYQSGYTFNQEATAGTSVTYTLPATATGLQYCVKNSIVSGTGAPDTGVLKVYPAASSYVILNGVRNTIGGGGTHGVSSGGAAGDAACFVAIDATDWEVYVQVGTWTAN